MNVANGEHLPEITAKAKVLGALGSGVFHKS
jgi:hypothetical protein